MSDRSKFRVALPETRQLDVLAGLLERRGVEVVRCPLVAIRDSPDRAGVAAWLERFCAGTMDLVIIYTGEGIRRLKGFAADAGLQDRFVAALGSTPLLTRGPKPARELRALQITPAHPAVAPTTDGVIETLTRIELDGRRVGVQLYGAEPLPQLIDYLASRGASVDSVAPYIYASESDDQVVIALIEELSAGAIDAIAFTSKAQVERLVKVARQAGVELVPACEGVVVAAVGPVVAADLEALGLTVDVVPESDYFMKPMVSALMSRLGG
jgi:uroporphyrinogen-III synthase